MASVQGDQSLISIIQLQANQIRELLEAVTLLTKQQQQQQQQQALQPSQNVATIPPFRAFDKQQEDWNDYLAQFEQHLTAHQVPGQSIKPFFLSVVGTEVFKLIQKLFPDVRPDEVDYSTITSKLTSYFEDQILVAAARYKFFRLKKLPGQTNKEWLTELRGLTRQCKFVCSCGKSYSEIMLRDSITQNIQDSRIRSAILRQPDPSLDTVLQLIEAQDTYDFAECEMSSPSINVVKSNSGRSMPRASSGKHTPADATKPPHTARKKINKVTRFRQQRGDKSFKSVKSCPKCISRHKRSECPSRNAICFACNKTGHVQAVCMSKIAVHKQSSDHSQKPVHSINVINSVAHDDSYEELLTETMCFQSVPTTPTTSTNTTTSVEKTNIANACANSTNDTNANTAKINVIITETVTKTNCGTVTNVAPFNTTTTAPESVSDFANYVATVDSGDNSGDICDNSVSNFPSVSSKQASPKQLVKSRKHVLSNKQTVKSSDSVVRRALQIERNQNKVFISLRVANRLVKFQLDTGASVTLVNRHTYEQLGSPKLSPARQVLSAYNGNDIPVLGSFSMPATFQEVTRTVSFLVLQARSSQNIFGLDAFDLFGLSIQRDVLQVSSFVPNDKLNDLCAKYSELFSEGIGCSSSFTAHVTLKDNAKPKFFKARPVPIAIRDQVAQELRRWQDNGVIKPISASQWASPLVILRKPSGKLRLCVDLKSTVNPQTIVDTYPLPRPEELMDKLGEARFYSKIDLAEAYAQVPLDEYSKKFLVINTHAGLFELQRLPFGSASAPAIFQRFLEQLTASVPCCSNYLDDIVVSGRTVQEHLENLECLFKVLSAEGLKLNRDKCSFFQTEIEYIGHIINAQGIHPLQSHLRAIKDLPPPTNIQELQAVMGKLNYYFRFIPQASQIAAPLHRLRRKNVPFVWSKDCQIAFDRLKQALLSDACLTHFDPNKPVILAVDASSYGLGAVLSHRVGSTDRPIAFASKLLNKTQENYSQIEKEALAIIYGINKFHHYLYGRKFYLLTDHKPLTSLFSPSKPVPPRTAQKLQRWALILSNYNYEIMYRPTKQHANADTLSRLPVGQDTQFDSSEAACFHIDAAETSTVQDFPLDYRRIAKETAKDTNLRVVLQFVRSGWPAKIKDITSPVVRRFFAQRHALSVSQGVLLLHTDSDQTRVLVPRSLQQEVLQLLHQGHWGIVRTKQLARQHCTWPGMDSQIEAMTSHCTVCAEHQAAPPQRFRAWPRPSGPWQRLHLDFAGPYWNTRWLVLVDAFSRFPFVVPMTSTTAASTIKALTSIFCIEGLPETLVSDNGPQFVSKEFKQFCQVNGIEHITTAPFHPQSNGEAERFVRSFKSHMDKLRGTYSREQALQIFLSTYRAMPREGPSPAELLHGRRHRTLLHLLHPPTRSTGQHEALPFKVGDSVLIRMFSGRRRWEPGTVQRVLGRNMFLLVSAATGSLCRRHANQLRLHRLRDPATQFLFTDSSRRRGPQPRPSVPQPGVVPMEVDPLPLLVPQPAPAHQPDQHHESPRTAPQSSASLSGAGLPAAVPASVAMDVEERPPGGAQGDYQGADGSLSPAQVPAPAPAISSASRPSPRRRHGQQPYSTTARHFGGEECGVAT